MILMTACDLKFRTSGQSSSITPNPEAAVSATGGSSRHDSNWKTNIFWKSYLDSSLIYLHCIYDLTDFECCIAPVVGICGFHTLLYKHWRIRKWINCFYFKDTSYVWGKKQQNLQLLYILASNSANKPSFQNLTKRLFGQRSIDAKSVHFSQLETIVQKSVRWLLKRWHIKRVIDQNIKKLLFFAVFASCMASILK